MVPSSRLLLTASTLDRIDCEDTDLHRLLLTPLFRKSVHEVCLKRLDADGVGRLLAGMFSGSTFPPSFVDRVFEESDGNPGVVRDICEFFLENSRGLGAGPGTSQGAATQKAPGGCRSQGERPRRRPTMLSGS